MSMRAKGIPPRRTGSGGIIGSGGGGERSSGRGTMVAGQLEWNEGRRGEKRRRGGEVERWRNGDREYKNIIT